MALDIRLSESAQHEYLDRVSEALKHIPERARIDALEYASGLMARGLPVLFDPSHVAAVSGIPPQVVAEIRRNPTAYYSRYVVPKRDGGSRELAVPTPALRAIQDWLLIHVAPSLLEHEAAHGFVRGRSIITNAAPHVGAAKLLKLDVSDFFGRVRRRHVFRAFRRLGYTQDVSDLLTTLTTINGALPQGAPTSPALANEAAFKMDLRITAFARRRSLAYTRYADDLTLSGTALSGGRVRRTLELIMRSEGFPPNTKKERYVYDHERQLVTGIVVNEKLNWPRPTRRWLRQEIHMLERYGIESHLQRKGTDKAGYKEYIYGHVYALKMARPQEAQAYLKRLDSVDWPY